MPIAEYIKDYNENGYCVVNDAISSNVLTEVLQSIDSIFAIQLKEHGIKPVPFENEDTIYQNMKMLFAHDVGVYLSVARYVAKLASVNSLLGSESVMKLVESLDFKNPSIPTSPVVHISSDELIIPNGYHGIPAHQDWPSIQGGLDTIIVWIPLMDVSVNQFPLEVIPKSHLKGIWEGEVDENSLTINPESYSDEDFARHDVKKGDVFIMSAFTVHRTGIKDSSGLRIATSTRYENSEEPTFVDRGYPCAYKRTVEREMITPDFPSVEQVKKVFKK